MKTNQEFDRSICFTFFGDYRETARELEADLGKMVVADYYNAIIDYALYEIDPELKGALKYVWHTTKTTIDKSIDRRARGFTRENTAQTERILEYKEENPNATQRQISEATNISVGKVNKVLKANSISNAITAADTLPTTNTTREREHEHASQSAANAVDTSTAETGERSELEELTNEELRAIRKDYKNGTSFPQLCKTYNIRLKRADNTFVLTLNLPKDIDKILRERDQQAEKEKQTAQSKTSLAVMGITLEEANELTQYLFGNGCSYANLIFDNGDSLETAFDTGMTAQEQLCFFRNNMLATREIYDEYIPKSHWHTTGTDTIYKDYSDYLSAYISNRASLTEYARNIVNNRN